jgi:hypothetical protein
MRRIVKTLAALGVAAALAVTGGAALSADSSSDVAKGVSWTKKGVSWT